MEVTHPQGACVLDEPIEVGWWAFSHETDEGHDPPIALDGEHHSTAAAIVRNGHHEVLAALEIAWLATEQAGGVVDPDLKPLLVGRWVAEVSHPARGP